MWNAKTKKEILNETERIGDTLLLAAETDPQGMSWKTMGVDKDMTTASFKWENIFSGVSGIVLFFLELYRQTQKDAYLNAAAEGMRWVENHCRHNASDFYSFYNGRMGVSYTLLKMFEVTKENHYLDKALAMAEPCLDFFKDDRIAANLMNGVSGTILGLLHLHAATGEEWLLERINRFVKYLYETAHPGPKGIYWDRNSQNINGLCGFGHGAAGIGFVLLELGRYFGNESFYRTAEHAFLYESSFYDKDAGNWLDLRKGIQKYEDYSKHEKAFINGNLDFFTGGTDVNIWIHGAAGIGLSRLRAVEILNKPLYEQEAESAIEKTIHSNIGTESNPPLFILGTGKAAYAELFLESWNVLKKSQCLSMAQEIAVNALTFQKEHKHYESGHRYSGREGNTSLFMGDPGIGYFYLRVLEPGKVPSILMPKVDAGTYKKPLKSHYRYLTVSLPDVKKIILKRYFERSILMAEKFFPRETEHFFNPKKLIDNALFKENFSRFMETTIPSLTEKQQKYMLDIWSIESSKLKMDEAVESHYLLFIRDRVRRMQAKEKEPLETARLLDLTLSLESGIQIFHTGWNWDITADPDEWIKNPDLEPGFHPVLLRTSPEGIEEISLSLFTYAVLSGFREKKYVRDALPEIVDFFEVTSEDQVKWITGKIIDQIKEAFFSGLLVEPAAG